MTAFFEWRDAPPGDYAVIGDPISHSLSPQMQAAAFAALNLNRTYRAIRVTPGEVLAALGHLAGLGYQGINVTVPHKTEARAAMRTVDEFAARCESVNTIRLEDMSGISTDGSGFLDTIEGLVPAGSRVLLLGAGGSARAIALALTLAGYKLSIFNRTRSRAHDLVRDLAIDAEIVDEPSLDDATLVVNATSTSLRGESPINFKPNLIHSLQSPNSKLQAPRLAYDLVYGETPFLQAANEAGWHTMDGKALLVAQGARSLEFWITGIVAPRDVMLDAIQ